MELAGKRIGFAVTGSHCTLDRALTALERLVREQSEVVPIVSPSVATTSTRFGHPHDWLGRLRSVTGREPLMTIAEVEPLGPGKSLHAVAVVPCTGNTLAKLATGITDTPVLMACKATLRNQRPVVLAISTNDGLGANAKNLGLLLNTRHVYFVPFGQDNPEEKPNSLESDLDLLVPAIKAALAGRQLQPILVRRHGMR
ncbi:MAG: dipicolinate synthase subunit B [Firmicutes bacterium]|nr:dipicolinate synthase subunit B [Bacillota bacterium]